MTGRDPFPFGKYGPKGDHLTLQQIKDEHPDYINWLFEQDWFEEKWSKYADWFSTDDSCTSTVTERKVIAAETDLLVDAPPGFKSWWTRAYGERLRKDGEPLYVPYLRVAMEAWQAALTPAKDGTVTPAQIEALTFKPIVPPAPVATPIKPFNLAPPKPPINQDILDEDVPF